MNLGVYRDLRDSFSCAVVFVYCFGRVRCEELQNDQGSILGINPLISDTIIRLYVMAQHPASDLRSSVAFPT